MISQNIGNFRVTVAAATWASRVTRSHERRVSVLATGAGREAQVVGGGQGPFSFSTAPFTRFGPRSTRAPSSCYYNREAKRC